MKSMRAVLVTFFLLCSLPLVAAKETRLTVQVNSADTATALTARV